MAGSLIFADPQIQRQNTNQKTYFASGTTWKLFSNNFTPVPNDNLGAFTEATYTGYSSFSLSVWATPYQIQPGEWQFDSGLQNFPACTSGSQTIYGVYLQDVFSNLLVSARFTSPVVMSSGGPPLYIVISPQTWAIILL